MGVPTPRPLASVDEAAAGDHSRPATPATRLPLSAFVSGSAVCSGAQR